MLSEMLQSNTRSQDLKRKKKQSCILKARRVFSKVYDSLMDLENSSTLSNTNLGRINGKIT